MVSLFHDEIAIFTSTPAILIDIILHFTPTITWY